MPTHDLIVIPRTGDPIEIALRELEAAALLVARGGATRVRVLLAITAADLPTVGFAGAAHAQRVGVDLRLERSDAGITGVLSRTAPAPEAPSA